MYITNKLIEDLNYDKTLLFAKNDTKEEYESKYLEMSSIILNAKEDELDKFIVLEGKLVYISNNEEEKEWCNSLGIYAIDNLDLFYETLTYIQSSGTQYIDTGIVVSNDDTIECEFRIIDSSVSETAVFGSWESEDEYSYATLVNEKFNFGGDLTSYSIVKPDLSIEMSAGEIIVNDTTYSITTENIDSDYTMYVFALNQANSPLYRHSGNAESTQFKRMFSFEIIGEDDISKISLVPFKKEDGEIGMLDTVTGNFFGKDEDSKTGSYFLAGIEVESYEKANANGEIIKGTILNYIDCEGDAFIDTGIKVLATDTVKIDFSTYDNARGYCFGAREGPYEQLYTITFNDNFGDIALGFAGEANYIELNIDFTNQENVSNTTYSLTLNKDNLKIDDEKFSIINNNEDAKYSLYLFGLNDSGEVILNDGAIRIYGFKILDENGYAKINLIPCRLKDTNEIGMWDTVSNQFFSNEGTGEFISGLVEDYNEFSFSYEYEQYGERLSYIQNGEIDSLEQPYINLGSILEKTDIIRATGKYIVDADQFWFGGRLDHTATGSGFMFYFSQVSTQVLFTSWGGISTNYPLTDAAVNNIYDIEINSEYILLNDYRYEMGASTNNPIYDFYLFGLYQYSEGSEPYLETRYEPFKLYSFQILDENLEMKLDLIPFRTNEGEIGMFDVLTNTFYENDGDGEFITE